MEQIQLNVKILEEKEYQKKPEPRKPTEETKGGRRKIPFTGKSALKKIESPVAAMGKSQPPITKKGENQIGKKSPGGKVNARTQVLNPAGA